MILHAEYHIRLKQSVLLQLLARLLLTAVRILLSV